MKEESFISNILGESLYDGLKSCSFLIVGVGSALLIVLFLLSQCCYWTYVMKLVRLCTGYSVPFLVYIAAFIVLLDIQVETPTTESSTYGASNERQGVIKKSPAYKLTILWGIFLIAMGCAAIYYSRKVAQHYIFQCTEYYVEKGAGVYHLFEDCEYIKGGNTVVKMKGYEFEESGYQVCEPCAEYAEDIESSADIYYRR